MNLSVPAILTKIGIQSQQTFTAVVLAGILSFGSSLTLLQSASAAPVDSTQPTTSELSQNKQNQRERLNPRILNAIRRDLSRQLGISPSRIKLVSYSQKTWTDGCLGLGGPAQSCLQALVPGWRVVVSDNKQNWVYRTDTAGANVVLDREASQTTLNPSRIPDSELPPPLAENELFRAISSGGITGRTYQTTLFKDGRLIRVLVSANGTASQPQTRLFSPQQVRDFVRLIQNQQLKRLNRVNYPAPSGAADYITVTLSSQDWTIRYADLAQNSLPQPLQRVIQVWNQFNG